MTTIRDLTTTDATRLAVTATGHDYLLEEVVARGTGPRRRIGLLSEILPTGAVLTDPETGDVATMTVRPDGYPAITDATGTELVALVQQAGVQTILQQLAHCRVERGI